MSVTLLPSGILPVALAWDGPVPLRLLAVAVGLAVASVAGIALYLLTRKRRGR